MSPSSERQTRISVVMATYNRRSILEQTLPSFLDQDYPSSGYEVVVVVDGSNDGSAEFARSLRPSSELEVLEQENRGPAAARNAGIAAAGGEIVLLMDDDIRATRHLVREHAAAHREIEGARVQGAIFAAPESPPTLAAWSTRDWYRRYDAALRAANRENRHWRPFLNANSSIQAELLAELGGFDEEVPFPREDFELAMRVSDAGIASIYRPQALAYEVFAKSSQAFVRDAVGFGRAEVAICRKHPQYRPESVLTPFDRGRAAPLRALVRGTVPLLPASTERALMPAVHAAETLSHRRRARAAGSRLLALQHRVVLLRAAADAMGSALELREGFDRWLPVLLYHRVGPGFAGLDPSLSVSPAAFERQVAWLARRGYVSIDVETWIAWREGRGRLPRKPVLVTFDDAYAEIADHALPVLRRHGFGALVFAVTAALGSPNTWDPAPVGEELPRLMTAEEVKRWAHRGFDFGAHGRTHRDLCGLPRAELESEVLGSRNDLETLIDTRVSSFAYPYDRHDDSAREVVSAAYELAFGATEGRNGLATPRHLQRRTSVSPRETLFDLEWRVRFGRTPFARLRRELRLRSRAAAAAAGIARGLRNSDSPGGVEMTPFDV
jgi:peptidoglycan/xylan/chitin deacetylase (PgdA/CDA1 family)/GT2 family glycosyltransferase